MTVDDFITTFREAMGDVTDPPFWSSDEIVKYLNAAVQEACERAFLIEDRMTPAVCSIPVLPGIAAYDLHASVLQIKRVALRGCPLDETSFEAMDDESRNWESRQGAPRRFIFEQASGAAPARIRLVSVPAQADTLALTVYRGALRKLSADMDMATPEIPERFHELLLHWMYRCAKLKNDAETVDKTSAAEHEAIFERAFGARPDANVQRKQRDKQPPIVQCSW